MAEGLEFDPGFAPYILAFQGTVNYLYTDINRFKVFSQRKMKFKMYYKKILEIFYNNLGFYIGCLMWAAYTKTQEEQPILNNHCLGNKYNEEENTIETDYMINFSDLFAKDMKYFLGENFAFEPYVYKVLKTYREFLEINKGFVETEKNTDIILPNNVLTENAVDFKFIIDKALKEKDLVSLTDYASLVVI